MAAAIYTNCAFPSIYTSQLTVMTGDYDYRTGYEAQLAEMEGKNIRLEDSPVTFTDAYTRRTVTNSAVSTVTYSAVSVKNVIKSAPFIQGEMSPVKNSQQQQTSLSQQSQMKKVNNMSTRVRAWMIRRKAGF